MFKTVFLSSLLIFCLSISFTFSQDVIESFEKDKADKTIIKKDKDYYQHGMKLNFNELKSTISSNPEASELMEKAQSNSRASSFLGYGAGYLIGYPIGTWIGGGEPLWGLAAAGAGLLVIAIPLTSTANKKVEQAVETYNKGLKTKEKDAVTLKLSGTSHGVGLVLFF